MSNLSPSIVDGAIVQVTESAVQVSINRSANCSACLDGRGCGAGLLRRAGKPIEIAISLPRDHARNFQTGQQVRVQLGSSDVLLLSSLAYGLPLVGLLASASLASGLGNPAINAIAAAAGALFGGMLARLLSERLGIRQRANPSLLE